MIIRTSRRAALALALAAALGLAHPNAAVDELHVMTSGAFTAPHLELAPVFERASGMRVVTQATSMGTGETSIPARLTRGEAIDVVIVAADDLARLESAGQVRPDTRADLARSSIAMAVRRGTPLPDITTIDTFIRTLLDARSIAYSASVSGTYLAHELFPRLGIADRVLPKSRRIEGERVGAVVARGEADIGFQQLSELLPIDGIVVVGPLPPGAQRVTVFSAGVGARARQPEAARRYIDFLASPAAVAAITRSGLETAERR